jgi:two-component system nitrogen regulation response regulator NtrX
MVRPVGGASETLILVVDDEPSVREMLVGYFEHAGYVVETAADGRGAIDAVRRRRPALVLLDVEMPGMDGVAALRGIREVDPRIPIIMVTGNESTRVAGEVIAAGAFSYLPKPVKLKYLDHLVATVLPA